MHRRPILECSKRNFKYKKMPSYILSPISSPFELLSASLRQVVYVLLTRSPRCYSRSYSPFDLHVLGMPPALILSQDQTLKKVYPTPPVLFSFQRPYFQNLTFVVFADLHISVIYYTTTQFECQHFFKTFLFFIL